MFQGILEVSAASMDVRRRGAILIRIHLALAVINVIFMITVLALFPANVAGFSLLMSVLIGAYYLGSVRWVQRGHVDVIGCVTSLLITSAFHVGHTLSLGYPPLLILASLSILVAALTSTQRYLVATALYNIALVIGLYLTSRVWGGIEMDLQLSSLLVISHLIMFVFGWAFRASNEQAFQAVLAMNQELECALDQKSEAEEASRAKSAFLANMSHELRTPLNAVIGYSEMITDELEDEGRGRGDQIVQDVARIRDAGKHLLSMISDVLDLSKIEAGRLDVLLDTFEVGAFVEEVLGTSWPLMEVNNNTLTVEVHDNCGMIRSDRTRLRQILLNLLSNSAKFTKDGHVTLRVKREHVQGRDIFRFEVTDTGIGMDEAALSRVFGAFEQADASTTRKYGGTGLGLALCKRLGEMLEGTIGVTSQPNQGTTFSLELPAVIGPMNEVECYEVIQDDDVWHKKHVLLIDDDQAVHDSMGHILRRSGYDVRSFLNAADALEHARCATPTVIILDILMPAMDGWEALRQIRADRKLRRIPVILVSILDEHRTAASQDADAILVKPLERQQVLYTLRRFYDPARESAAA